MNTSTAFLASPLSLLVFSQFGLLRNQGIIFRITLKPILRHLANIPESRRQHRDIKLRKQTLHDVSHPFLAHDAQPVDPHSTNPDKLCTDAESLDDVGSTSDAGVEHDCEFLADACVDNVLKGVETGDCAVDLAAGVVGDHNAVDPEVHAVLGVCDGLDTGYQVRNVHKGH